MAREEPDLIRAATSADSPMMLDIYRPFVVGSATTFEITVPTLAEFEARRSTIMRTHPWLVICHEDKLLGYAYAAPHREREAYQWATEVSVYVHPDYYRRGIARQLYGALLEELSWQGFCSVLALITLPNEKSVRLHESMGFRQIGVCPQVGFKLDAWHDVGWWQLRLGSLSVSPRPLRPPRTRPP